MDPSRGSSQHPGQSGTRAEQCPSCAIGLWAAERSERRAPPFVAEEVAENVVVLSGPELDGLAVLPFQHVGGLEQLSDLDRAHVLAALQRATRRVRDETPESAAKIVVMSDPPASEGHVCFQVLPTGAEDPADAARNINK